MTDNIIFSKFPDVLTISDMQKALGIGRSMAYRLIHGGKVKHLRIGKAIKIPKQFLIDYALGGCYSNTVATSNLPVRIKEDTS